MRRLAAVAAVTAGLLAAGGASVYTLRASGASRCPDKADLQNPVISFKQAPKHYITVTLTNPNRCYGFLDEPVELSLYGANGRRLISYYGDGPPHSDVGVCCTVTLPPRGTWTITLGSDRYNGAGLNRIRVCNIHVRALKSNGYDAWKPMPEGGSVTGRGSFPPGFNRHVPPIPDDPGWRAPCGTEAPR